MTATTRMTAKQLRDPLLKALGNLTGLKAGEVVSQADAINEVLSDLGVDPEAWGQDSHGRNVTALNIQQAFNRMLRKQGDGEAAGRGKWTLTDKGVKAARLLVGDVAGDEDDTDLDDLLDAMDDDGAGTQTGAAAVNDAPNSTGLSWSLGDQVNTYSDDAYIRGIAVESTPCFGHYSARSSVCANCPISGGCKAVVITNMASVSARLRKRDEEAALRAAKPTPEPATPAPTPSDDADEDISSLLDLINDDDNWSEGDDSDDGIPSNAKPYTVQVPSKCRHCKGKLSIGDEAYQIPQQGVYHKDCVKHA
jgi:hypothetical protein